jgi:hypothetical protein
MGLIAKYRNGNASVELHNDGTRVITTPDPSFQFEYPLNLDIRVSTRCLFGRNPKTGKGVCEFCHESATTTGVECDYEELKATLDELPKGIELAVGCNDLTDGLEEFIIWCGHRGFIVSLTVNQGHLMRYYEGLDSLITNGFIKGLGISYRRELKWTIPDHFLNYENTVFHTIAGIDDFNDVLSLKDRGVKKILILGEKDFGFNEGKVDLKSQSHKEWFWWVSKLFTEFDAVSFDNLALEQLRLSRFFTEEQWEEFNQGEYSFYINAVDKTFAPSSRSKDIITWNNISIREYFKHLNK